MQIPPSIVRDIAGFLPPISAYSGIGPQQITPWVTLNDPLLQKTAAAAMSLQHEFHRIALDGPFGKLPPEDVTFGFIAVDDLVEQELRRRNSLYHLLAGKFTFGAAILIAHGDDQGHQHLLRMITVAGVQFPVVVITGTVMRNSTPPSPNHLPNAGTSSCWAKAGKSNGKWTDGILTAGHVVGNLALGTSISMLPSNNHRHPATATLVEVGPQPIDGAILKVSSLPSSLNQLSIRDPAQLPIAPGVLMHLNGRHTAGAGTVLRVNQNPGYFGPMMAERIVHDVLGVAGDSGGLVADQSITDGLGIHIGTIPSKTGASRDGLAQGMWQVTEWFAADVWT